MRNDRTTLSTEYRTWLHGVSCPPPGSASYESLDSNEEHAANEEWEAEGGSVGSATNDQKIPL